MTTTNQPAAGLPNPIKEASKEIASAAFPLDWDKETKVAYLERLLSAYFIEPRVWKDLSGNGNDLEERVTCRWWQLGKHGSLEAWASSCGRNNLNAPYAGTKFCCFCGKEIANGN